MPSNIKGYCDVMPSNIMEYCDFIPSNIMGYCDIMPSNILRYCDVMPSKIMGYCDVMHSNIMGYCDIMPSNIMGYCDVIPCNILRYCDVIPSNIMGYCDVMPSNIMGYCDIMPSNIMGIVMSCLVTWGIVMSYSMGVVSRCMCVSDNHQRMVIASPVSKSSCRHLSYRSEDGSALLDLLSVEDHGGRGILIILCILLTMKISWSISDNRLHEKVF